jgi:hypothetical protein
MRLLRAQVLVTAISQDDIAGRFGPRARTNDRSNGGNRRLSRRRILLTTWPSATNNAALRILDAQRTEPGATSLMTLAIGAYFFLLAFVLAHLEIEIEGPRDTTSAC